MPGSKKRYLTFCSGHQSKRVMNFFQKHVNRMEIDETAKAISLVYMAVKKQYDFVRKIARKSLAPLLVD